MDLSDLSDHLRSREGTAAGTRRQPKVQAPKHPRKGFSGNIDYFFQVRLVAGREWMTHRDLIWSPRVHMAEANIYGSHGN